MSKFKHFKLRTVRDCKGEHWDVYNEHLSISGISIPQGWPFSLTPKDGIGSQFSYILTVDIAEYIRKHTITEVEKNFGLSNSIVAKFRRTLGIQTKFFYRNNDWLIKNQDALLYDSIEAMNNKFGINKSQVYKQRLWLAELIDIPSKRKLRDTKSAIEYEN